MQSKENKKGRTVEVVPSLTTAPSLDKLTNLYGIVLLYVIPCIREEQRNEQEIKKLNLGTERRFGSSG